MSVMMLPLASCVKEKLNASTIFEDHFAFGTFYPRTVQHLWLVQFSRTASMFVPLAKPCHTELIAPDEMIDECIYYHNDLGLIWVHNGEYYWFKALFSRGSHSAEKELRDFMCDGLDPLSAITAMRL